MNVSPQQALLQRNAQYTPIRKASARAPSLAVPQDLLGAAPQVRIEYSTSLAAGLQGPDAAEQKSSLTVPGSRVNTLA